MARRFNLVRFRRLLLIAMVLILGAVAALFLFGRAGRDAMRRPMDEGEISRAGEGTALIGEDFDYTFTERERPVFRIRGESIRADQEGTIYLDGVSVTLYDEQGRAHHVESREASFSRASNEGRLLGNVVLKGPTGLTLRTAQLHINEKGRVLVSPRPVVIEYADAYVARGERLRINLNEEMFLLAGNTRVESLPGAEVPLTLTADKTVYERNQRLLRVEGDALLKRGTEQVRAERLSAWLTEDEKDLTLVRALWDVSGRIEGSGDRPDLAVIRFKGRDLAVQMQPGAESQPRKVILEGGERNRAMIETSGAGITRTLTALQIEGMLAGGALTDAEAFGGVELRETTRAAGGKEVRRAAGNRARAGFGAGGQLASIALINNVTFRDEEVRATGSRATLDLDAGRGEFFGNPVEAESPRGRMTAPRVFYNVEHEVLNAVGGVRAVMTQVSDSDLAGTPLGEGDGPVWVESREAFWRQDPPSFLFRGDVRAWRGENLLLTSELRGDQAEDKLTAAGGVKTLWIPAGSAVTQAEGRPRPKSGEGEVRRAPVEVVAQEMIYREGTGLLTYTGDVRVLQEGKTLTCEMLQVELGEDDKAETMTCTGDVRLNDPKGGRHIAGQKAVYHLDERRMEITGDKVTLRDREGNQVQGRRVVYFVDDGKVEVKGRNEAPAAPTAGADSGSGGE